MKREGGSAYESDFDVESLDQLYRLCSGELSSSSTAVTKPGLAAYLSLDHPDGTLVGWISASGILFTLSVVEQRKDEGNGTRKRRHRH